MDGAFESASNFLHLVTDLPIPVTLRVLAELTSLHFTIIQNAVLAKVVLYNSDGNNVNNQEEITIAPKYMHI